MNTSHSESIPSESNSRSGTAMDKSGTMDSHSGLKGNHPGGRRGKRRGSVGSSTAEAGGWSLIKRGSIKRQSRMRWQELEVFCRFTDMEGGGRMHRNVGVRLLIKPWPPKGYAVRESP